LNRGQRRREALITESHSIGNYNAAVRHDVLITGIVCKRGALKRGTFLETITRAFVASYSKVHLKFLDFHAFIFSKPAAFLGRVSESGEHAFRRGGITTLDNECAVSNGSFFHSLPFFKTH